MSYWDYLRKQHKTVVIPGAAAGTYHPWQTEKAITITGVRVYRAGGTGGTVQVTNAGSNVLASALASATDAWAATTTVQNATVAAGAAINVTTASVAGSPTELVVQIDYKVSGS